MDQSKLELLPNSMIPTLSKIILVMGLRILATTSSFASDIFTYQGKLTNAASAPLTDGQYRIGVRVWDVASGGEKPLWSRKYEVPVVGGVFSLMIGAEGLTWGTVGAVDGPLTASLKLAVSGTDRFLEITVMSDVNGPEKPSNQWQVLSPRQQLGSVPYAMNGVPVGTVVPFAGSTAPDGWLICNGNEMDPTDPRYKSLHGVIGFTYGQVGQLFRVPDLRRRTAVGADSTPDRLLGAMFGAEKHKLTIEEMPAHKHDVHDLGHSHGIRAGGGGASGRVLRSENWGGGFIDITNWGVLTDHANISENSKGEGVPHNIIQPSLALNYIIKL